MRFSTFQSAIIFCVVVVVSFATFEPFSVLRTHISLKHNSFKYILITTLNFVRVVNVRLFLQRSTFPFKVRAFISEFRINSPRLKRMYRSDMEEKCVWLAV